MEKECVKTYCMTNRSSQTSIVISVSTLGPGTKVLINQGDFHAEGDSILLLNGVSTYLETENQKRKLELKMPLLQEKTHEFQQINKQKP